MFGRATITLGIGPHSSVLFGTADVNWLVGGPLGWRCGPAKDRCLGSLVVVAWDSRHDGCDFISRLPRWVTVFGRANDLSISPSHAGQLSLLLSTGWETIPAKVQRRSAVGE